MVDIAPQEYERALIAIYEAAGALSRNDGLMVRPRCAPTFRRIVAERDPDSMLLLSDAGRCLAGKNYCRITPEGRVTPCPYMPLVAGDVRRTPFAVIWREASVFQTLRQPLLEGRCGRCAFRELCGGCRARAYASAGDVLGEDPSCNYQPDGEARPPSELPNPLEWSVEAEQRLRNVPVFLRSMVRRAVERFARTTGHTQVTPELMDRAKRSLMPRR